MTLRPFTVYDKDWQLVCLLCTELPSLDNGTARLTEKADGTPTIATVRYWRFRNADAPALIAAAISSARGVDVGAAITVR